MSHGSLEVIRLSARATLKVRASNCIDLLR